jgi:hypothetical protein
MKYLPLFHHFKAIYQFPKHIICWVKIVANASLTSYHTLNCSYKTMRFYWHRRQYILEVVNGLIPDIEDNTLSEVRIPLTVLPPDIEDNASLEVRNQFPGLTPQFCVCLSQTRS